MITLGFVGVLVFEGVQDKGSVEAATIIVDCNGGGNYLTIQAAVDAANPGDKVYVWAGTYYENVIVDKSISLIGNHSSSVFIDGGGKKDVVYVRADYVNITGFTFTNCGEEYEIESGCETHWGYHYYAGITLVTNYSHIYKNICAYNNCDGIILSGSNNTIEDNFCYSNEWGSIDCAGNDNKIMNNTCSNSRSLHCSGNSNIITKNSCLNGVLIGCSGNLNIITNNTCGGVWLSSAISNYIAYNNCTWEGNDGFWLRESHKNIIKNNTIGSFERGMLITESNLNSISNNLFVSNELGLACSGNSNIFSNNIFNKNGIGIYPGTNTVINNTFLNDFYAIFLEDSKLPILKNNKMISCGIRFWYDESADYEAFHIDKTNTVNGKPVYFWKNRNGGVIPKGAGQVILINCSEVTVKDQNLDASSIGVTVVYSDNITIKNNSCSSNLFGIKISKSKWNKIINNNSSNCLWEGICVGFWNWHYGDYESTNNYLIDNICNNNDVGILICQAPKNLLINNTCSKNLYRGIDIGAHDCILKNNKCDNNEMYGIFLCSPRTTLYSNSMSDCGLYINGDTLSELSSYTISANNTVNGKPIYFWKNENLKTMPSGAGQIILINCRSITITNQNVSDGGVGISLYFSNKIKINNNTCNGNVLHGIHLLESSSNTIENNICNSNKGDGIRVSGYSYFNIIQNNICNYNEQTGLNIGSSESSTIKNNIFRSNKRYGIAFLGFKNNIFYNNTLISCGFRIFDYNFEEWTSNNFTLDNTVNGKPIYYWKNKNTGTVPAGAGQVVLLNCTNVTVKNQNLCYGSVGISLHYCENIKLLKNNCDNNNLAGIYVTESKSIIIENNTCNSNNGNGIYIRNYKFSTRIKFNLCNYNNESGIYLYNSDYNQLDKNICMSNMKNGLTLYDSNGNIIRNNLFILNHQDGVYFDESEHNIFTFNTFLNNTAFAVNLTLHDWVFDDCMHNLFHHNNFINNNQGNDQICNHGWNNTWHTISVGNYWSDYKGQDNGAHGRPTGDGISDTNIPFLPLDLHPAIKPFNWGFPPFIPQLKDPGVNDTDGNYKLTWTNCIFASGYIIEEDTNDTFNSPRVIFDGLKLNCEIKHKNNGTYFYRVRSYNEFGLSDWSNIVDIIIDWLPDIPKNFNVTTYPPGNVLNLSWTQNLVDTIGYEIYSNYTGNWSCITVVYQPNCTFNHTNLINSEKYYYKIRAYDAHGQVSKFSDIITAIPWDSVAPAPPTGLKVVSTTNDSITLSWEPNTEEDFEGYNIYRNNLSNPDNWDELIGTILKGNTMYTDEGLDESTTYFYVITAFDEVPNESKYSNLASGTTKLGLHGPEINNSIADFEIPEDNVDNTTINLYRWFKDINNDPLSFWCEGNENISVSIYQSNGTVVLVPEKDWNGQKTLTFFASDGLFNVSDNVTITVTPVNDPPGPAIILTPENGNAIYNNTKINFTAECDDPDLIYGDILIFTWLSNLTSKLGEGKVLNDTILPAGEHLITLKVSDLAGRFSIATINISILGLPKPLQNDTEDNTTEENERLEKGSDEAFFYGIIIGVIVLILIIVLLLILIKKKKLKNIFRRNTDSKTNLEQPSAEKQVIAVSQSQPQPKLPQQMQSSPTPQPQADNTQLPSNKPQQAPLATPITYPMLPPSSNTSTNSKPPSE